MPDVMIQASVEPESDSEMPEVENQKLITEVQVKLLWYSRYQK